MLKEGKKWRRVPEIGFSLVLAFVFWFTVIMAQTEVRERVFSIPIEYIATPANIALVGDKATEIKVHLAGPRSDLNGINLAQLAAKVNLANAKPGEQTHAITEENLQLPKGVRLLDSEPSTLVLSLKEIVEKEVIVKPQLVGRPPEGFQIVSVAVSPKSVRVLSPAEEEGNKEISVMTTPIYLENIREDTSLFCKIIAPPTVQPADKRWPDVEVHILVSFRE